MKYTSMAFNGTVEKTFFGMPSGLVAYSKGDSLLPMLPHELEVLYSLIFRCCVMDYETLLAHLMHHLSFH